MKKFNVIWWDFNSKRPEAYDIMPYLMDEYKKEKEKTKILPETFEQVKNWIKSKSMYMYWSRCQYEIIIKRWPPTEEAEKIDIHEQIMMNIDVITEVFIKNIKE